VSKSILFLGINPGLIIFLPVPSCDNVLYVMYNSVRFEWDAEKNRSNQKKHAGIDLKPHRAYSPMRVCCFAKTVWSTVSSVGTGSAP
jgi:hypothetical protein